MLNPEEFNVLNPCGIRLPIFFVLLSCSILFHSNIRSQDTVWVDDGVPAGAVAVEDSEGWDWAGSDLNPKPFSDNLTHRSKLLAGTHQHYFYGAADTLAVGRGDTLIAYVYLDPVNPPSEVMLQWNDATWEHRAYWGTDEIDLGTNDMDSRRYMGPLPVAGEWVRLEVAASQVGLEGRVINGMAFTLYGGAAAWDYAGKSAPESPGVTSSPVQSAEDDETSPENVAALVNGGQPFASSTNASGMFPSRSVLNGDRTGAAWGQTSGGWNDGTPNVFPDTFEIHFDGEKIIEEIDIYTLQDNWKDNPVEPTLAMTFSLYGITDFNVGYFDAPSNQWVWVASIRNNNKVVRQIKLSSPARTQKISIVILNARSSNYPNNSSRLVEVEVWGSPVPGGDPPVPGPSPTPSPTSCARNGGGYGNMDPCELSVNLLSAMGGNRTGPLPYRTNLPDNDPNRRSQNWTSQLKFDFSPWQNFGSQNKPVLAHVLALWRDPAEYGQTFDAAINWWTKFLTCQTDKAGCQLSAQTVKYFKGGELFSNTYDADITLGVIAVRYWALNRPSQTPPLTTQQAAAVMDIAAKARTYLRRNWAIYALGAGKSRANKLYTRFNHGDDPPFDDLPKQGCHGASYTGPFIAVAGMRSTHMHTCQDNRSPLLARAIGWTFSGNGEDEYIAGVTKYMVDHAVTDSLHPNDNHYGLDGDTRAMLKRHINGQPLSGEDTTGLILNILKDVRLVVPFHFLGGAVNGAAGAEIRMTLMEDNLNQETAPTFAVIYDYPQRLARILFPWNKQVNCPGEVNPQKPWRSLSRFLNAMGHADLRLNSPNPSVWATSQNRDGAATGCKGLEFGLPIREQFNIPSNWVWKYHIKFRSDGEPLRLP